MTPLQRYRDDLRRDGFAPDAAQRRVVRHTERLYQRLVAAPPTAPSVAPRLIDRLLIRTPPPAVKPVQGLYLWGGVGRGKTYMVDAFFECLPLPGKLRAHFHSFMQRVHRELKGIRHASRPLQTVADRIALEARVLCFDEFQVSDITDAMLLGTLLRELFARGVVLVATSNLPPDRLYWGGLQRERFLPAIDLIRRHTRIVHVDGAFDYRLRALERAEIYHHPLDDSAQGSLAQCFASIAPACNKAGGHVEIDGRLIATVREADGVVWFTFEELCGGARSVAEYIEIARCYQTVFISDIPQMDDYANDAARRFVHLVDEFYDRGVKLIVSAMVAPGDLYRGERLASIFERTASRLMEMQSLQYLARQHLST